jgi:hypothetical protein
MQGALVHWVKWIIRNPNGGCQYGLPLLMPTEKAQRKRCSQWTGYG